MTHPGGRPLKFSSPEELEYLASIYFDKCLNEEGLPRKDESGNILRPLTLTGLCLHLGTTRDVLDDYLKKPEYSNSVKMIKMAVENYYETRLSYSNATGPIFALKNFGWKDTQILNHGGQEGSNPIDAKIEIVHIKSNESRDT